MTTKDDGTKGSCRYTNDEDENEIGDINAAEVRSEKNLLHNLIRKNYYIYLIDRQTHKC